MLNKLFKHLIVKSRHLGKNVKVSLSANLGLKSRFGGNNRISRKSSFNGIMGKYTYLGENSVISGVVGSYTSIGSNVLTLSGRHPVNMISTSPVFYSASAKQCGTSFVNKDMFDEHLYFDNDNKLRVKIGNDVWIGNNAILMPGIVIGDGAVIGAGAVVTKDVEPYTIVGGVPAHIIRYRFSKEEIDILCKVCWWDWPENVLREKAKSFSSPELFFAENGLL